MNVATRNIERLPLGTAVSRYLRAKAHFVCSGTNPGEYARQSRWADTPQVEKTFDLFRTKAGVVGGTTTDSSWAGPLHATGIGAEALTIVRGMSILGAAQPLMRRLPFNVASPRQTGTGSGGGWVAEGASIATVAYAFDSVTPQPFKLQSMTVITDALAKDPFADQTVRTNVFGTHVELTDTKFLDPTVAAVTNVNPASITNGATAITSTGTTAAQITADLGGMLAGITTAGTGLTWIMRPTTLARIALALPGSVEGGRLLGIPVIASGNSPQQVTLVDLAEIAYADSDRIDLDVTKEAAVQMDSAPTNNSRVPTATNLVSLFQVDSVAYRTTRWLWWLRVRCGSVAYMTVTY